MRTLEDLLARQRPVNAATVAALVRPVLAGGDAAGRAALASECARVQATPPGGRDDALNLAAYRMGQLVGGGHLELETVLARLTEAGLATGQTQVEVERALRQDETGALVQGIANPRRLEPTSAASQALTTWNPPVPTQEEHVAAVLAAFPSVDWHEVWAEDAGEDWIVEPLIPARRLVALYSPPKAGKSLLCLELAASIASGRGVLGGQPRPPRRVLYVDFENDVRGDVVPRLQAMGYGPDDLRELHYKSFPALAALDSVPGGLELLALAQAHDVELVIIDTISRAIAGEENANDTWLAFYRHTGAKLKAAGIGVLRLDHSGKDVEKGMRGGSAKYSDVDAVWQLSVVEADKTIKLVCTDNRFPITEKELVLKRHALPKLWHQVDPEGTYGIYRDKLARLVADLDQLGVSDQASNRTCRAALTDATLSAPNSLLASAVKLRQARAEDVEQ